MGLHFLQVEDADGEAAAVPAYAAKSRYHKGGSNVGLRAWGICRLTSVKAASKKACTCRHVRAVCMYMCKGSGQYWLRMFRSGRSPIGDTATNSGTARSSCFQWSEIWPQLRWQAPLPRRAA